MNVSGEINNLIRNKNTKKYFQNGLMNLECFCNYEDFIDYADFTDCYYELFTKELKYALSKRKLRINPTDLISHAITPYDFIQACCVLNSDELMQFMYALGYIYSTNLAKVGYDMPAYYGTYGSFPNFNEYYGNQRMVFYRIINALEVLSIDAQCGFISTLCDSMRGDRYYEMVSETIVDQLTDNQGEINLFAATFLEFCTESELISIYDYLQKHINNIDNNIDVMEI